MSQQDAQPGEKVQLEDRTSGSRRLQPPHEATQEAQAATSQDNEEDWPEEAEAQNDNTGTTSDGSQEEQKPPLSKKEKLLAKRAKLDAQIKREEEKERKERTHRLCILAGTILRVEKYEDTLKNLIVNRAEYDLTDEEVNNMAFCIENYSKK